MSSTGSIGVTYLPATISSDAKEFRTGRSQGNLARTPDVAVVIPLKQVFGPCG
jgi:hypothetical protein